MREGKRQKNKQTSIHTDNPLIIVSAVWRATPPLVIHACVHCCPTSKFRDNSDGAYRESLWNIKNI